MYNFKTLTKRILHYVKNYKLIMFLSLLFASIYVFSTIYAPYIIGQEIIISFVPGFSATSLIIPFIKLIGVTIGGVISGLLMGYLLNKATYNIVKDLQIDAFNKLLTLPVSYLDSHPHGDILARVTSDVDRVWDGLLHGFTHIFRGAIAIILTIVFMFLIKWDIALVVILLTPLSLIIASLVAKFSHSSFAKQAKVNSKMTSLINEMISEQKTVIAYDLQNENNTNYQSLDQDLYKVGVKAQFTAAFANPGTRLANSIVYAAVALYGTILIVKEPTLMNAGILATFLFYASHYTRPFNEISGVAAELANSYACLRRVLELIDEIDEANECNLKEIEINKNEFNIKNVNFAYSKEKQILKNISFDVLENKKVALVGPTGCGKTTLINILMRYYDVNNGEILLDNKNIKAIKRHNIRSHIGMVLQDTWLFKGTVMENIRYSKLKATDDEVISASIMANAHDFISKLPNGYNTVISDDDGLSIGQKQLICIARVMLALPNILILDEATSNIDTRTEVKIQKAFDLLMEGRTSIVIAHRLSTIRNADLIVVMNQGEIVEQGSHEELLKKKGFYSRLYNSL